MMYPLGGLLLVVGLVLLVFGFRLYGQPKVGEQISVWRTLIPVLDEPADHFYTRLYQALKASLQERLPAHGGGDGETPVEIVLTGMGFGPHRLFAAPSLFSERPVYLLVRYQHLRCYIYAGQTPTGLFVSAWGYSDYHVGENDSMRLAFTKRAWKYFSRQTLFQYDAALMFTTAVHDLLADTVDAYREAEGLQPLEALERRPILHAFYHNPFYQQQHASAGHSHHAPPPWSQLYEAALLGAADGLPLPGSLSPMPSNGHAAAAPRHFSNAAPPHPTTVRKHPVPGVPPTPQPLFAMDTPVPPQPVASPQPIASSESVTPGEATA